MHPRSFRAAAISPFRRAVRCVRFFSLGHQKIVPWVKRLELFLTGYTRLVYRVKSSVTNSLKCESVNTCEICLHWRLVCNLKVRNCSLTGFGFSINKKRLKRRSNYLFAELNPFAVPHYELQLVSFTVDKWMIKAGFVLCRNFFIAHNISLLWLLWMFQFSLKLCWLQRLLLNELKDVSSWNVGHVLKRGNGAVEVSFESRTAQVSALFHIFTCAFCLCD